MMRVSGRVLNVRETIDAFGGLPSLFRQAGMGAMSESLQHIAKTIRDRYLVGPYPSEIERRSGSLRATFQRGHPDNIWEVQAQGTQILGAVGSKDKRVRVLNDGGTITPTRSKFLAVRTEFTKTPRGVVREKYQAPLRTIPNTFVRMRDEDHGTVFEVFGRGRQRRIMPIAWLVRSVTIVGRRFMQKAEATAKNGVQAIFQQKFDTVLTQLQRTFQRLRRG